MGIFRNCSGLTKTLLRSRPRLLPLKKLDKVLLKMDMEVQRMIPPMTSTDHSWGGGERWLDVILRIFTRLLKHETNSRLDLRRYRSLGKASLGMPAFEFMALGIVE
jgi:hypothetical protein